MAKSYRSLKTVIVTYSEKLNQAKKTKDFLARNNIDSEIVLGVNGRNLKPEPPWTLAGKTCKPVKQWYDVHSHRVLTLGEIGCLMSHYMAWEYTKDIDEDILYLEEDISPGPIFGNLKDILREMNNLDFDLAYLGQRTHDVKPKNIGRYFCEVRDYHRPWWTSSYCLSKEGRKKLLSSPIEYMMCPADDYLPSVFKKHSDGWLNEVLGAAGEHKVISTIDRVFSQYTFTNSTTERGPYLFEKSPFKTFTFSAPADYPGYLRMLQTAPRFGYQPINVSTGEEWNTSGTGGLPKFQAMNIALENVPDDEIVLFVDGWDTMFNAGSGILLSRYNRDFKGKMVIASEMLCWPPHIKPERYNNSNHIFRYLNSGVYIGPCKLVRETVKKAIDTQDHDDQGALAEVFLTDKSGNLVLDSDCKLFQCINGATKFLEVNKYKGNVFNNLTKTEPAVLHFNGNSDSLIDTDEWKYVGGRYRNNYGEMQ